MTFEPAKRQEKKLKLGIMSAAGAGKTTAALLIARSLVGEDGRIALIDTENGSASLYSDLTPFDSVQLAPPFTTERYIELMLEAHKIGYDCLIIDSGSHAWESEGGILDRKSLMDAASKSDGFKNWQIFKREQRRFMQRIVQFPHHLIFTMRSKTAYDTAKDERGKLQLTKIGTQPVQEDSAEYEFDLVLSIDEAHFCTATKDRTRVFDGKPPFKVNRKQPGTAIREWLAGKVTAPPDGPE